MKIVNTCKYANLPKEHPAFQRVLSKAEFITCEPDKLTSEELLDFVQGADALITGIDFINAELIAKLPPCLKVISRPAAGFDRVDIKAARAHGIDVCNAPGSNKESVADYLVGLMLMAARDMYNNICDVRAGKWGGRPKGMGLGGKTLGIVGLGAIGRCLVPRCKGFGMNIVAYDPFINLDFCKENDVESLSFDELLAVSDFIVLVLPLNDESYHIINADAVAKMKDGVIIANDARGAVVDTQAIIDGLNSGKIAFYAADVTDPEPPPADYPLLHMDNVIITPHIGAHTEDATNKMMEMALDNVMDILEGKECKNIVNH